MSRPTGAGSGAVLVAAVAFRADASAPISAPAGWSQVVRTSCTFATTVLTQAMFVRVVATSEPAAYTFSTSNPTGGVGSILAYTGVDPAQPVHASAGAFTRNTKAASPAVTTSIPQTRIVGAFSHSGTATIASPPGMTSRSDAATGGSSPTAALLTADETQPVAGSYTRKAQTQVKQDCNVGQLVALRSAPDPPANTSLPTVSGTAREGATLTTSPGTWSGSPTSFANQWRRCNASGSSCADIPGATGTTYALTSADVGSTVRVLVTASNAGGSASASSAATAVVIPAAAPVNVSPPAVSGSAREGHVLSASTGAWSGSPTSYAYEWQRCDGSGSGCAALSGADEDTYSLDADDVGTTLRVLVSATNAGGTTSASSAPTAIVLPAAPTNTSPPTVSGEAREGQTLTASTGEWTEASTTSRQWERCNQAGGSCVALAGETGSSHLLGAADIGSTLRVVVTATNAGGSTSAASPVTAPVLPLPPANLSAPTISGTAQEGQPLSATTGTWSGSPTSHTYAWQRSSDGSTWTTIPTATSPTYTPVSADVGSTLRILVTATNAGGSTNANSTATETTIPAAAPANVSSPTIAGTAQEGHVLSATTGGWSGSPTSYAYEWQRCDETGSACAPLSGDDEATYELDADDVGSTVRVLVTASNAGGSASASSAATAVVIPAAAPVNVSPPAVSGSAREGHVLSASTGAWSGSPTSYAYEWQRCDGSGSGCAALSGADEDTYSLDADDVGTTLRVLVSATNAGGTTSASSAPTAIVLPAAPTNTSPPTVSGEAREGQTLTASTGEWTEASTTSRQWERCNQAGGSCVALAGETGSSHLLGAADIGSTLRVVVTATNAGGSTSAASPVTAPVLPLPPANLSAPTISGTAQEGQPLSATTGTWSGSPTSHTYAWQRSSDGSTWTTIPTATSPTYTPVSADVGSTLRILVTATNAGGSTNANSTATASVAGSLKPASTVPPTMAGFIQGGRTLDAAVGTWTGSPTSFVYQWQQSTDGGATWVDIPGATAARYVIPTTQVGRDLRVRVTATNAYGSTGAPSFGARVYPTGNLAVLVNKSWNCNANVNLDLVKVTMWTIDVDSVVFNTGCTGRIGRVEVDTWTGDGVKVTNASANAAHDLVVESGYTSCFNRLLGAHQDGVQVMGGARITFRNFVWMCGNMDDVSGSGVANAVFISRAGANLTTPTDIVVEHSVLMPGAAHTFTVGVSLRSGARNSVLCPDRTGSNPFTNSGATDPVYLSILEPPISDPRCSSFASALAWAQGP